MRMLRLSDGNYPMSWNNVKADFPNTSFPKGAALPEGYAEVLDTPKPVIDPFIQDYVEIAPILNGAEYEQAFEVIDFTGQELTDSLAKKREQFVGEAKREAHRRILAIVPEWNQRNLLAQAAVLAEKGRTNWTAAELTAWDAGEAIWAQVEAIRAASDNIEAMGPIPDDYSNDKYWLT
jgi:hypothetical protein